MQRKYIVPAVVGILVLAMLGLVPVVAAVGDAFAVGRDSTGADLFRIKSTGAVVTNGPLVQKRLGTATNANLTNRNALVGVTDTSVARGIYLPDASSCDVGHTVIIVTHAARGITSASAPSRRQSCTGRARSTTGTPTAPSWATSS